MDTTEHTELGNALRFEGWDVLKDNPYLHFDENGTLHLALQGLAFNGLPEQIDLNVAAGVIIGMSGDYFGGKEVELELPSIAEFNHNPQAYTSTYDCTRLGDYLIKEPITSNEEQKFIRSYQRLANKKVQQKDIDTIYAINDFNYVPFSSTLNEYVQQVMFALRVKNYSEILNRNLSHFTPWSVRAYLLGHHIALKYARIYYELKLLILDKDYKSDDADFNTLRNVLEQTENGLSKDHVQDLVYRYQALSLGMELFSFHYYTDHFAAGHEAMMGDLRALLPARFGVLGGILVNSLHDELNTVTVYTKRPYDLNPNHNEPPIEAGGDGDFDKPENYFNRQACLEGMHASLQDIHQVFNGGSIPEQQEFSGLKNMPDIDENYRQPQPLFLLGTNDKIYYRRNLSNICVLSPSDFKATYAAPLDHGYTELSSKFEAFMLVIKLRLLSYFYQGTLQTPTAMELSRIEAEERQLNPGRLRIQKLPQNPVSQPTTTPVLPWQTPASNGAVMKGLEKNGLMPKQSSSTAIDALAPEVRVEGACI